MRSFRKLSAWAATAVVVSIATLAQAEVPSVPRFSISPVFTALDLNPTVASRPSVTGVVGFGGVMGFDGEGKIIPGIAVDTAPVWLILRRNLWLEDFRTNVFYRALSRLTLSMGTSALPSRRNGTAAAVAARWVITDSSDPRLNEEFHQCIKADKTTPTPGGFSACQDRTRTLSEDKGLAAAVAWAMVGAARNDRWEDMRTHAMDWWGDVSYGIPVANRVIAITGALRIRSLIAERDTAADLGVEVRSLIINRLRANVSAAWKAQKVDNIAHNGEDFAIGGKLEYEVHRDTWLSLSATYEGGRDAPVPGALVLAGMNYAF